LTVCPFRFEVRSGRKGIPLDLQVVSLRRGVSTQDALHLLCQVFDLVGGEILIVSGDRSFRAEAQVELLGVLMAVPEVLERLNSGKSVEMRFVSPGFLFAWNVFPAEGRGETCSLVGSGPSVSFAIDSQGFGAGLLESMSFFLSSVAEIAPGLVRSAVVQDWRRACVRAGHWTRTRTRRPDRSDSEDPTGSRRPDRR
jgi:hypothetical protein